MPELPEVETTLRGLVPFMLHQPLQQVQVHSPKLRHVLQPNLAQKLAGRTVTQLTRRNKLLLFGLSDGHTLLMHLGMTGRFAIAPSASPPVPAVKHTHLTFQTPKASIAFIDPRRFGLALHVPTSGLATHPLLAKLGPEPLTPAFTGTTLFQATRGRATPIKPLLMLNTVVVGVGNIYASESLFRAGLHPSIPANQLTAAQCAALANSIKATLTDAIAAGGTTLRNFQAPNGQLGYFHNRFAVYGRKGQPCPTCATPLNHAVMAQRATFWCPACQPANKPRKSRP